MWINNGWVDYNIPQIYWEIGHPAADYDNLIHWWAKPVSYTHLRGEKMGEWLQEFIHEAPAHDFPIFAPYYELTQEQKDYLWHGPRNCLLYTSRCV